MSKVGYLTAAEYRAIRQTLGMTQAEAKEFHKVKNIMTIKRWEKGTSRVSELACDKIMALFERVNWSINQALEQARKLPAAECEVVLVVYPDACYSKFAIGFEGLPNSVHRAMIQRTYVALRELGYSAGVVEFNPQDYLTYLAARSLTDSQDNRGAWACDYRSRFLKN